MPFAVVAGDVGYQAPLILTGGRGPPQYRISREQLTFLKTCGFTAPQMAHILNVSLRTVRRRLRYAAFFFNIGSAVLSQIIVGGFVVMLYCGM